MSFQRDGSKAEKLCAQRLGKGSKLAAFTDSHWLFVEDASEIVLHLGNQSLE